jgi:hypothetical protein
MKRCVSTLCVFFKNHWDRIATYTCFGIFGALQLFAPLRSTSSMPPWASMLFNLELVLASILLMASLFWESARLRIVGYTVYLIGMLTISTLILVNSGSSIWILVLGFAFQGAISVRYVSRDRRVASDLSELVDKLEERKRNGE